MWCGVITLFPLMFKGIENYGMTHRAINKGLLSLKTWYLRDFATDKQAQVDDRPYGGGPGMVMMAGPLRAAIHTATKESPSTPKVIYVSPSGRRFDHEKARRLAEENQPLLFISGRYEGIDQRIIDHDVDEILSIGDYVLSGGDLAVMVIIDALTRWIPGALGHEDSALYDAFSKENLGLLDCPHYTRPACLNDGKDKKEEWVPDVLRKGDHQAIQRWRLKQTLGQTWLYRADLLQRVTLDETCRGLLAEFQKEYSLEN